VARQVSIPPERASMRAARSAALGVVRGMVLPLCLHTKMRHSDNAAGEKK